MLSRRYIAAGMAYMKSDTAQAAAYFGKARQLATARADKFNLRDLYYQLSVFYRDQGNYAQAYQYFTQHIAYRDSIVRDRTASDIAELETRYETEKKITSSPGCTTPSVSAPCKSKSKPHYWQATGWKRKKQQEIDLLSREKALQQEQLERQELVAQNARQQLELAAKERQLQERRLKSSRTTRNFLLGDWYSFASSGTSSSTGTS